MADEKAPEEKPVPRRPRRRRRLLVGAAVALVALLLVAGLVAFFFVRTGGLNRTVQSQVQTALAAYGARAEFGTFELGLSARTATATDVKIYDATSGKLIASVDKALITVETPDLFAASFNRKVVFKRFDLTNLQAYVDVDENGRLNLAGLHGAPPSAPSRIALDFDALVASINGGTLHVDDRSRGVSGELDNLNGTGGPIPGSGQVGAKLTAGPGRVVYQGRETPVDALELDGKVGNAGAEITGLTLRSAAVETTVAGRVDDWSAPKPDLTVTSQLSLDEAGRVFAPDQGLGGAARFDGRVTGDGKRFRVEGLLTADDVAAAGARARGARVEGVTLEAGGGEPTTFSTSRVTAAAASASGASVSGLDVANVSGEIRDGATSVTVGTARLASAAAQGAKVSGVVASDAAAEIADGRTRVRARSLTVSSVVARQARLNGVALRNAGAEFAGSRYSVTGDLSVASGTAQRTKLGPVKGKLAASDAEIALTRFDASLLGGRASGDVKIRTARGQASRLSARFVGMRSGDLFSALGVADAPVAGTVSGKADVSWPGLNFNAVSGAVNASFEGRTQRTESEIPLTGELAARARGGVFDVDRLVLNTDASRLEASGRVAPKGNSDLQFTVTSTRAEELQTLAESVDAVKQAIAGYGANVAGNLEVRGTLTGRLANPTVAADLSVGSVAVGGTQLGSLTGSVDVAPDRFAFRNGALATANGGSAKIEVDTPRDPGATTGRADVTFDRLDVATLTSAGGLGDRSKFVTGLLTGEAHLTGLPEKPTGQADVRLVDGTVAGRAASVAEANVTVGDGVATLNRAELRLPEGSLTAKGTLVVAPSETHPDAKFGDFEANGQVTNVDLAGLATSLGVTSAVVTGAANATFDAKGNLVDVSKDTLTARADATNVTVNGRDVGALTLTANTSASGRVDVDLTTAFVGITNPLHASVELRQPGRPLVFDATLTNFDIGPVLAALSPGSERQVTGALNGTVHVEGPTADAAGDTTTDRLTGRVALAETTLQLGRRPVTITPLTVSLASSTVTLSETHVTGAGIDLRLGGELGFGSSASTLNFSASGTADLATAIPRVPGYRFGGIVTLDARVSGAASAPELAGGVRVSELYVAGDDLPVAIARGNGNVVFSSDKIRLESFTALANDGQVTASGEATLAGLKPTEWHYVATAREVEVFYQGADVTLDGDFTLAGTPNGQLLSGTVTVPTGEYATNFDLASLSEAGASAGGGASDGFAGIPPIALNVRVDAANTILIRNDQVNTVASAALTIGGTANDPAITGRVAVEGGTIKFRAQRYDIVTGTLDFPAGGATPEANFLAEGDVSGYHVTVGLQGPIDALDINLNSDPTLPRAEIISLVATGRTDSNTLNSQDALASGLGAAGSILSQEFISEPTQSLLGLNRFAIDPVLQPNANPAARLTVGTQLARDLSFTYSTNVGTEQDQSAIAEYTVTNRFSGIVAYTQGGSQATGQRTDSDVTFEVRGRKRFSLGYVKDTPGPTIGRGLQLNRPNLPDADVTVNLPADVKLSNRRLRELAPVETQGFSRALARLGERNLTNYFQEKGYFFARVTSRCDPVDCSGPNLKVLYDVRPGQRLELKEVEIEGVDGVEGSDTLKTGLASQESNALASIPVIKSLPLVGGYARGITSGDRIRNDRETIRSRMADLGYRDARVTSRLDRDPNGKDATLVFTVEPGVKSTLANVQFEGNSIVSSDELLKELDVAEGQAFSPTAARDAARRVKTVYADRGFLDATAQYRIEDVGPDRVGLVYEVTEGPRAVVDEVVVTGQTETKESSIRRFVSINRGDVLTPAAIRRTQRDLYATGAFSEVQVRDEAVDPSNPGSRRVTVRVTEARPLLLVYGLGYSTDDGPRGTVSLTNTNLFGRANTASMRLRASPREQLVQLQYTDLRPFGSAWATTVSAFYDRNSSIQSLAQRDLVGGGTSNDQGPGYGISKFVAFVQLERKLSDIMSTRFRYSYEDTNLFNAENIPIRELGRNDQSIRLGLVSVGFTRDTRDSALDPTTGELVSVDHTLASRAFGGSEAFNKFFANYERFQTLSDTTPVLGGSVLAFSARVGLASPYSVQGTGADGRIRPTDRLLPISERFFAGGATTLRGFRFEEAGPQGILEPRNDQELPTLVPLGGDALTVFNFELRYPLTENVRVVPFYDLGNVFRRVTDISFEGMTHTVGLGLRYKTPLGPIGVDYGYLLDPPSYLSATGVVVNQPHWAFHVRFGPAF